MCLKKDATESSEGSGFEKPFQRSQRRRLASISLARNSWRGRAQAPYGNNREEKIRARRQPNAMTARRKAPKPSEVVEVDGQ